MLKMVDGTGIIGVDMICPLGISTPQPPNYDRVELEGTGMLVLPNSLDAPLERLELGGKTEQVQTTGANLFDEKLLLDFDSENYDKTQSGSGFYYYKFPVNGTVTASTKNANKNGEYLTVGIKPDGSDKTWLSHGSAAISKYKTLTPEDGNIYLGVNNSLERVKSMIQNTGGIIINEGSAAKPYEPYKEQTLTLTSDRPITKFDKLVEQDGKIGWLYKSKIDTLPKTGYGIRGTDGNKYGVYFGKTGIFKDAITTSGGAEKDSNFFTHFKLGNPYSSNGDIAWLYVNKPGTTDLRVRFADESINTVELFEKYMADKDIKILYETAQTEFVPLPQSEQNAIRALKTYYPTTVITADGGELDPDIKATYRKEI